MEIVSDWGYNATETGLLSIIVRLALAAFLGGLIGLEREATQNASGFRTHMLVATAAALFTALTVEIYFAMAELGGDTARLDPLRVIEAVTAGVAFLAAGSIIRSGKDVKGLTTGAALWMAGAIGVACGAGFYVIAAVGTALALIITYGLRRLEMRLFGPRKSPGQ